MPRSHNVNPRLAGLASVLAVVLVATGVVVVLEMLKKCSPVVLQVSSSTEKAAGRTGPPKAMDLIARDYNAAKRRYDLDGGQGCATVEVSATSSGTAERGLATDWAGVTGQPQPQVWLPTSSAWVSLLRHERPGAAPPAADLESLAQSPLVLAMPKSKADSFKAGLREAGITFDWSVLGQLVQNGKPLQWGQPGLLSDGDPAWQGFSLRKDDPVESTSGLFALIAVSKAAAGARLSDAEIPEYLRRIERLVPSDINPDGTQMMRDLRFEARCGSANWGAGAGAVVVQESLMYQYDTDTLGGTPNTATPCPAGRTSVPEDLVPIYSSTNWVMDHPYVRLPNLTPAQRAAADDFLTFVRSADNERPLAEAGLRDRAGRQFPDAGLTDLNNRMSDEGDLLPDEVTAPPENTLRGAEIAAIRDRWLASRKPVHLLVLIDESGTMKKKSEITGKSRMAEVHSALQRAQAWLGRNDEFAIAGFAAKSRANGGTAGPDDKDLCRNVCVDSTPWAPFDQARFQAAVAKLHVQEQDDDTPLYQAIMGAQQQVARRKAAAGAAGANDIYAVVVMTDGVDDYWGQTEQVVLDNKRKDIRSVPVYPVCFGITAEQAAPLDRILKATTGQRDLSVDVLGTSGSLSGAFVGAFSNAVRPSFR
ncbi:MAG: substrate-binding domain-containing protein [Actinoplanes sp.]